MFLRIVKSVSVASRNGAGSFLRRRAQASSSVGTAEEALSAAFARLSRRKAASSGFAVMFLRIVKSVSVASRNSAGSFLRRRAQASSSVGTAEKAAAGAGAAFALPLPFAGIAARGVALAFATARSAHTSAADDARRGTPHTPHTHIV